MSSFDRYVAEKLYVFQASNDPRERLQAAYDIMWRDRNVGRGLLHQLAYNKELSSHHRCQAAMELVRDDSRQPRLTEGYSILDDFVKDSSLSSNDRFELALHFIRYRPRDADEGIGIASKLMVSMSQLWSGFIRSRVDTAYLDLARDSTVNFETRCRAIDKVRNKGSASSRWRVRWLAYTRKPDDPVRAHARRLL